MKIGVDLDATLLGSKLFEITFKQFKHKLLMAEDYNMSNYPRNIKEELYKRFNNPFYMCDDSVVYPYPKSKETLKKLKKYGNELFLITARNKEIRLETLKLINRHFPAIFEQIHFVSINQKKENKFRRLNLETWIDDNPNDILSAVKLGIPTIMISNKKTPYNHHLRTNNKLTFVNSFHEVLRLIKNK